MLKKMGAWTGLLGLLVLLVPCQGRSESGLAQVLALAGNGRSGYQIVIPDGEPTPCSWQAKVSKPCERVEWQANLEVRTNRILCRVRPGCRSVQARAGLHYASGFVLTVFNV